MSKQRTQTSKCEVVSAAGSLTVGQYTTSLNLQYTCQNKGQTQANVKLYPLLTPQLSDNIPYHITFNTHVKIKYRASKYEVLSAAGSLAV